MDPRAEGRVSPSPVLQKIRIPWDNTRGEFRIVDTESLGKPLVPLLAGALLVTLQLFLFLPLSLHQLAQGQGGASALTFSKARGKHSSRHPTEGACVTARNVGLSPAAGAAD